MYTINEFAAATLIRKPAEVGTVRIFEDCDDRGHWFGLEQYDGKRWTCINPAHPTFFTHDAAHAYVRMKFN